MERSTKLKYGIGILLLLILILAIIAAFLAYFLFFSQPAAAFEGRPLVLIHTPLNNTQVPLGERVFIHATARAEDGIQRVELWVDSKLVNVRESPLSASQNPLVLASGWTPVTTGRHIVVVKGVSVEGAIGQATIYVVAVEPEPAVETHTVGEGETFESIAEEFGVQEDELEDLNPDLDPESIEEGDDINVPGGGDIPGGGDVVPDGGGGDVPAPEGGGDDVPSGDDGEPPDPHPDGSSEPEDLSGLIDIVEDEDAVQILVEILALQTDSAYEGVHCFAAFGGGTHQRYPGDGSFATLSGVSWEVASMLSGPAALHFGWPPDQTFEMDVNCVGITGGGTESVDLGNLFITALPISWDGVTRRAVSSGEEGNFTLDYRVSYAFAEAHGDKEIDPNMASPTNLRLDYTPGVAGAGLAWDYTPNPEEPPITGFIIYMNGNLMWTVGADQTETSLPYEWMRPACGLMYSFEVSAYRNELPEGPESYPAAPPVLIAGPEPGSPDCQKRVIVSFETLTTNDLGGDGDTDPGDMGPVYGDFYAGDQNLHFDGRCSSGSICTETSFNHYSEYDIEAILSYTAGLSSIVEVAVPEGEELVIGYDLTDDDTNNPDDPICDGFMVIAQNQLDEPNEYGIESDNRRCSVKIKTMLSPESRVGQPGEVPPLPWLVVEDIYLNPGSSVPWIDIRNDGDATWQFQDITIEATSQDGESYGQFTFPGRMIAPRETTTYYDEALSPSPPLDLCVLLDPNDEVFERGEATGALVHHPVCAEVPDLRIIDAHYDEGFNQLFVTVENASDTPLENSAVEMFMRMNDGLGLRPAAWLDVSIPPWATTDFVWTELYITPDIRQSMLTGYTLEVDPRNQVAEEDDGNNSYSVPVAQEVQLAWLHFAPPFVLEHSRHRSRAHLTVDVVGARGSRRVMDKWTPELDYRPEFFGDLDSWVVNAPIYADFTSDPFEMAGDERLLVNIRPEFRLGSRDMDIGSVSEVFTLDDLNQYEPIGYDACAGQARSGRGRHEFRYTVLEHEFGTLGLSHEPYWTSAIGLCYREE